MALVAAEIEGAAPDAWTGKSGSLTYESETDVADWLVRRGYTAFNGADADDQETHLILATADADNLLRSRFRGQPRGGPDQGLIFPAYGAYDNTGRLSRSGEGPPRQYLEAIRLIAERRAAGTWLQDAEGLAGVKREKNRYTEVEYRDGSDPSAVRSRHPEIWRLLRMAIPRLV